MKTIDVFAAAAIALPLAVMATLPASAAGYTKALNACYEKIEAGADVRSHKMTKVKSKAGGRVQLWIDSRLEDRSRLKSFCVATTTGQLEALESAPGKWAGKYKAAPYSDVASR